MLHSNFPLAIYFPLEIQYQEDYLITIHLETPKIWKQPRCSFVKKKGKENVVDTYNGILLSHKEGNPTICHNMDGPGDMKLATEGQILYDPS